MHAAVRIQPHQQAELGTMSRVKLTLARVHVNVADLSIKRFNIH